MKCKICNGWVNAKNELQEHTMTDKCIRSLASEIMRLDGLIEELETRILQLEEGVEYA